MRSILLLAIFSTILTGSSLSDKIRSAEGSGPPVVVVTGTDRDMPESCVTGQSQPDCGIPKFRFLEISNEMFSPNTKWIHVFMEEKSFNEDNLKKLFAYVSGKYVGPENLTVMVYTNWEQLPLKLDCSDGIIVHEPNRAIPNYHKAIYRRKIGSPTREYFVYSTDLTPQSPKFRTVGLQGVKSSDEGHIW